MLGILIEKDYQNLRGRSNPWGITLAGALSHTILIDILVMYARTLAPPRVIFVIF